MKDKNILNDLVKRLCSELPDNLHKMKKDLEKNFHVIVQNTFNQLDLVTREEFDAQSKVLSRSRKKIEQLEERLAALEKKKK